MIGRYWRVRAYNVQSGTNYALAEVEFRATIGGPDQAAGGTAIASTVFSGRPAANAFDNDPATLWATATDAIEGGWIGYDFGVGATITVLEISLKARNDSSFGQAPVQFVVEYSNDNVTWTEVKWYTAATWTIGSTQVFAVPATVEPAVPRAYAVAVEVLHVGNSQARVDSLGVEVLRSIADVAPVGGRRRQTMVT